MILLQQIGLLLLLGPTHFPKMGLAVQDGGSLSLHLGLEGTTCCQRMASAKALKLRRLMSRLPSHWIAAITGLFVHKNDKLSKSIPTEIGLWLWIANKPTSSSMVVQFTLVTLPLLRLRLQ